MTLVRRVARPMLAAMFVVGGLDALRHPKHRAAAVEPIVNAIAAPLGLPEDPELLVRATGATMLAGGSMLALGKLPRIASLALASTLVPATLTEHQFWKETDPDKRREQQLHFLKNLGLLGGVLLASVDTAGKPGLAYRARMAGDSVGRAAHTTRREAKHAAHTTRREAKHAARAARREARLKVSQAHDALS